MTAAPMLCLATGLVAAALLDTPALEAAPTISIAVDASLRDSGRLDEETVIAALRLRLGSSAVRVESEGSGPWSWQVRIGFSEKRRVQVRVLQPDGPLLVEQSLGAKKRRPRDLAHTIALLVVETLAPLAPELFSVQPEPEPPSPRLEPVQVDEEEEGVEWMLGAAGASDFLLPRGTAVWGIGVTASAALAPAFFELDAAWWLSAAKEVQDVRLRLNQVVVRLAGGAQLELGYIVLGASVGPVMRAILAGSDGSAAAFTDRADVIWGLGGRVSTGMRMGSTVFSLAVDVANYAKHPRYFAGEQLLFNAGNTTLGLVLGVAWRL